MFKVFDFKKQMEVGDKGEQHFCRYYSDLCPQKSEDRKVDFLLKNGKSVELKSDSYSMKDTENFFIEVTSHNKLGGPFRAKQDGIDYFVYYFIKDKTFFWFNTNKLCEKLEEIIAQKTYKIKTIRNKGWTAEGYAISRADLEDIQIKKEIFK